MPDKKNKEIVIDKPEQPTSFVDDVVQAPPATDNTPDTTPKDNPEGTFGFKDQPTTTKMVKLETPIGTEIEMTEEEARKLLSGEGREDSQFTKNLNEILVNVSQERLNEITEGLKKGVLKLQFVKGGKVIPNNIDYVPITYGQNKRVNRIMKYARLLREDINETIAGRLELKDLAAKYKDIIDEDMGIEELKSAALVNEVVGNYVIAQKAKIYWEIDEIENYVLSDLVLIIGLYERRNSYTNT